MNRILEILLILLFLGCIHKPNREYRSLDLYTGGLNDFSLILESKGSLKLIIKTSRPEKDDTSGTYYTTSSVTVFGKWNIENNKINFSFEKPKKEIDKIFVNTAFDRFIQKDILIFSKDMDTAYVYGIPCPIIKTL